MESLQRDDTEDPIAADINDFDLPPLWNFQIKSISSINEVHGKTFANAICSTKYTWYSWLPKSIFEQFRRVANAYFLGISVLMILGTYAPFLFVSPLDPFSTIGTLLIILLITSFKEGYEDLLRKRSDEYENTRLVTIVSFERAEMVSNELDESDSNNDNEVNSSTPRTLNVTSPVVIVDERDSKTRWIVRETVKQCQHVNPGEIVKLEGTVACPVDLLPILTSMHGDGNKLYIETANIDGETNLKLREAPTQLIHEFPVMIGNGILQPALVEGSLDFEPPSANIHKFMGTMKLSAAQEPLPIGSQNLVLRGAVVSNTDWVYGLAVYTGKDTKIQMNSLKPPSKMSRTEQNLNRAIIIIFCALVSLVVITVISVYLTGFNDESDLPYVYPSDDDNGSILPLWLELMFVFFLLFNNFIPMSMYVTIEIVNLGQSYLISSDEQMYNESLDVACTVRSSNMVQELGMVSNVFSDKTGTLTCNEMNLVKYVLTGTGGVIQDIPGTEVNEDKAGNTEPSSVREIFDDVNDSNGGDIEMIAHDHKQASNENTESSRKRKNKNRPTYVAELKHRDGPPKLPQLGLRRSSKLESTKTDADQSEELREPTETNGNDMLSSPVRKVPPRRVVIQVEDKDDDDESTSSDNRIVEKTALSDGSDVDAFQAFLRCLMTCHTVVRESDGTYRSESPDELALVLGAGKFDCALLERGSREMVVRIQGQKFKYQIMAVNAFNSDRKRMSVMLKESKITSDDNDDSGTEEKYLLVCKGADNIMLPLCDIDSHSERVDIDRALLALSKEGLRTLVIAQKELDPGTANSWMRIHRKSMVAMNNRDEQIAIAAAKLEQGMHIVGVTAIEDRLQDEVPEVIADLASAGIIVWMLTGDKLETAVNIGHACNLVLQDSEVLTLSNIDSAEEFALQLRTLHNQIENVDDLSYSALDSPNNKKQTNEAYERVDHTRSNVTDSGRFSSDNLNAVVASVRTARQLETISEEQIKTPANLALVLDGPSFSYFNPDDAEQRKQLLNICSKCRSVIACRLTPIQKRELVALVKKDTEPMATTLSIGDGANDVAMILEANVGVGIYGKEGRQAANNADFAIGEFKFLRRLLLLHGRYNYVRQATVFLYSMHKNLVITMTLFWFSFFTALSGASPYESWIYSCFNFVLGLPIIFFGMMDRDLSPEFVLRHPQVYRTGRLNSLLDIPTILQWILNAILYAVVVCLLCYYCLAPTLYDDSLFVAGTIVFVGMVMALQAKVAFFHHQWAYPQICSMLFSLFGMHLYFLLIEAAVEDYNGVAQATLSQPIYWLFSIFTVPLTAIFIDWGWYFTRWMFYPTPEMLYREIERKGDFAGINRLQCRGLNDTQ